MPIWYNKICNCGIFFSSPSHFCTFPLDTEHGTRKSITPVECKFNSTRFSFDSRLDVKRTHSTIKGWKYLAISMISVATAMLCKEQGITVTGICAVYEIFVVQKVSTFHILFFIAYFVATNIFDEQRLERVRCAVFGFPKRKHKKYVFSSERSGITYTGVECVCDREYSVVYCFPRFAFLLTHLRPLKGN